MKPHRISSPSTLNQKNQYKKAQKSQGSYSVDEVDKKLKLAVNIMPVVIVLIIGLVLFFSIRQFTSLSFSHSESSAATTSESSQLSEMDQNRLLTVVTSDKALPSNYRINLKQFEDIQIDALAYDALQTLMNDAKQATLSLSAIKGYVSTEEQNELYNTEVNRLMTEEDYSRAKAEKEAELTVPSGNHADQQTGLSVTFASNKTTEFENSDEYQWLIRNAYKYGFVMRYPEGKEDSTNMKFEPSLFRYVGKENASKMITLNMCLDDYVVYLNAR